MLGARVSEPLPGKRQGRKVRRGLHGREGWAHRALKLPLLQGLGDCALDPPKMIRKH